MKSSDAWDPKRMQDTNYVYEPQDQSAFSFRIQKHIAVSTSAPANDESPQRMLTLEDDCTLGCLILQEALQGLTDSFLLGFAQDIPGPTTALHTVDCKRRSDVNVPEGSVTDCMRWPSRWESERNRSHRQQVPRR